MDLRDHGALELSRMMASGKLGAEALMAATLDRVEAVNGAVNAIVSLRDRDVLMAEARAADRDSRGGWLHGIPLAVKDNAAVAGIPFTDGSPLFADRVPDADQALARRLRGAGGIVIGKTNIPEFALGSHTYNPVFGTTANPYAAGLTCGGSSGGAAVALATGMVAVADGTDMMGSLRNPAGWNNVYGFRPTWGRVLPDAEGDTYLHRLSTPGPMARNVEDLVALLRTLSEHDPRWPGAPWPEIDGGLDADIRGKRIGWLGDWGGAFPYEAGVTDLVGAGLRVLEEAGAVVEPVAAPMPREVLWEAWATLRAFGIAAALGPFLDDAGKAARLKPAAVYEIETGRALTAATIQRASEGRSAWLRRAMDLFERYDALVLPTAQCFPFDATLDWPKEIGGVAMDTYHRWMEVMIPASLIGLPALGVPVGFGSGNRPMGMQIMGAPGRDLDILSIGEAYHRATDWPRKAPPPL